MSTDYERYNELLKELNRHVGLASANVIWQEVEAIKNRHGGMPPSPPRKEANEI